MRRVQIALDERPTQRSNNTRGGHVIVGELADPQRNRDSHWFWLGAHEADGRAVVQIQRKKRQVRRVLWTIFRNSPSVEKVIKGTCEAQSCVNPWHAVMVKRGSWQVDPDRLAEEQRQIARLIESRNLSVREQDRLAEETGLPMRLAAVGRVLSAWDDADKDAKGRLLRSGHQ